MQSVKTVHVPDGRRLTGYTFGPKSGTPLLFIAGAGTGKSMYFAEGLLDTLGVRLITMDRAGMGGSDPDPARTPATTAADYCAFVADLLDQEFPYIPAVANSQGAIFGLAAAIQGWVQRLVLASPADDVSHPAVRALMPEAARGFPDLVQNSPDAARDLLGTFTPESMRTMVYEGADARDMSVYSGVDFEARYQAALAEGFARSGVGYIADTMMATTSWNIDLDSISTPVHILFGARDQTHSPDHGATLASRIPNAQRTVLEDAGGSLLWSDSALVLKTALQISDASSGAKSDVRPQRAAGIRSEQRDAASP